MNKPNLILIHTHDTGRHLGCYGVGVPTPNLSRLAAEGVLFRPTSTGTHWIAIGTANGTLGPVRWSGAAEGRVSAGDLVASTRFGTRFGTNMAWAGAGVTSGAVALGALRDAGSSKCGT